MFAAGLLSVDPPRDLASFGQTEHGEGVQLLRAEAQKNLPQCLDRITENYHPQLEASSQVRCHGDEFPKLETGPNEALVV